jgi:hypothetical protein
MDIEINQRFRVRDGRYGLRYEKHDVKWAALKDQHISRTKNGQTYRSSKIYKRMNEF